jgi:hypothetical protein
LLVRLVAYFSRTLAEAAAGGPSHYCCVHFGTFGAIRMLATAVHEAPWQSGFHEVKDEGYRLTAVGGQEGSVVHDVMVASAMRPLSRTSS